MTPRPDFSDVLAGARAETVTRTRRHAEQCVLLALVTSTDVAAALIDQAVELSRSLDRLPRRAERPSLGQLL